MIDNSNNECGVKSCRWGWKTIKFAWLKSYWANYHRKDWEWITRLVQSEGQYPIGLGNISINCQYRLIKYPRRNSHGAIVMSQIYLACKVIASSHIRISVFTWLLVTVRCWHNVDLSKGRFWVLIEFSSLHTTQVFYTLLLTTGMLNFNQGLLIH